MWISCTEYCIKISLMGWGELKVMVQVYQVQNPNITINDPEHWPLQKYTIYLVLWNVVLLVLWFGLVLMSLWILLPRQVSLLPLPSLNTAGWYLFHFDIWVFIVVKSWNDLAHYFLIINKCHQTYCILCYLVPSLIVMKSNRNNNNPQIELTRRLVGLFFFYTSRLLLDIIAKRGSMRGTIVHKVLWRCQPK